jgi:hypothetical protein
MEPAMPSAKAGVPLARKKLPARYNTVVTPLIISIFMSCIVSGISTLKSIGLIAGFISAWMSAWAASWVVAFPTLILILPVVRRIVGAIVHPPGR